MASLQALKFGYEAWLLDDPNGVSTEELPSDEIYIERERHYVRSARPLAEMILHRGSIGTAHFWRGVFALGRLSEPLLTHSLVEDRTVQWTSSWERAEFLVQSSPARIAVFGVNLHRKQGIPAGPQTTPTSAEARQRFFDLAAKICSPDFIVDPELVAFGEKAAARLKANENQDIGEWARHLADDLGKLKD